MLNLETGKRKERGLSILCLGAHCDDIEIGCGGTILQLLTKHHEACVTWVVFTSDDRRARESTISANHFLHRAKRKEVIIKAFKDGFLPYDGGTVKQVFEELKATLSPDLIFTHYGRDLHQDHRLISELTWNTWRNHFILEYEIPKYDGDLGSPNCFVELDGSTARTKCAHIVESFASQKGKHWFSDETFLSILRLRAVECRAESGYAEAFYGRKLVLNF